MTEAGMQFKLPRAIESLLATLSKLYAQEGQRQKQEIIVNARVRIHEQWSHDNWNGGIDGHALYLTVPENLYLESVRQRTDLESEIGRDINKIHNIQGEFVDTVFLEMEPVEDPDWRRETGLLQSPRRTVAADTVDRIWKPGHYRVFLSHKAEVKTQVALLKPRLGALGADCFVAHQDIHPTRIWQDEIESALTTMDAFVALLTEDFHDSDWTDQEVGFALGRGVPLVAVKLGKDPYGFIGRFQALSSSWEEAPLAILRLLVKEARMVEAYVSAVEGCSNWNHGNSLAKLLSAVDALTGEQARRLVKAFNENGELSGSYGFNGAYPGTYGDGLASHLERITGEQYEILSTGELRVKT